MIAPTNSIAVLDACVLYPAPVRDLLLSLAEAGIFSPQWSELIQDEWQRNLLLNRRDLRPEQLRNTTMAMNLAFPEASVLDFEDLIPDIVLPDLNDRHVLACAIKCRAAAIVTFNLQDFPSETCEKYGVRIQHPDEYIADLIVQYPEKAHSAFNKMVGRLKTPAMSVAEVRESLIKCGLSSFQVLIR
jgi:predicted nucleic acid-binding protein